MTASYYFWKWAENDLPGRPTEVHAALLRGELHPALQIFDANPLLRELEKAAAAGLMHGEEWNWETVPSEEPFGTRFVHVTSPMFNESRERVEWFYDHFLPLELSGIDEEYGRLIPCLRPKLSHFIPGQFPEETSHDIDSDYLPVLLRKIVPGLPEPWAELLDRNRGVVAIAKGRRFYVEWRENSDWRNPRNASQWRARDAQRLACLSGMDGAGVLPPSKDPELLRFADTMRIFGEFLRGAPRPRQYCWKKIKAVAP